MQEFILGNMCQDLLMHTILMCGKVTDKVEDNALDKKTLRFPKHLYDDIVPDAKLTAKDILKNVVMANACKDPVERLKMQQTAVGLYVYFNKLVFIFKELGYISDKQRHFWQGKITAIEFKTRNWITSDTKR